MNDKQKNLYMKRVVALCLSFCAVIIVATYVALWFGVDTTAVMTCGCGLFGGELVMTCVIKLISDKREKGKDNGQNHTDNSKGDAGNG